MSLPRLPLRDRAFAGGRATTVGLGPCRESGDEDPAAIVTAIALGCTVLDTAPFLQLDRLSLRGVYPRGAHERAVGEAVRTAVADGVCRRERLIVTTSIGQVPELLEQGIRSHGYGRMRALVEATFVRPGVFGWDDLADGVHTIAPGYVRVAVADSLARTGLDYFDCVFLDAPTTQGRHVAPTELRRRVFAAVEALEGLRAAGKVRSYGFASTVGLDIEDLVRVASHAGAVSALRVPFSLLVPDHAELVERAADLGLHVFASGVLDGGVPQYQLPAALEALIGVEEPDAAVAIRWAEGHPGVGTALFASRNQRHIRAVLTAAARPRLDARAYVPSREDAA